MPRIIEDELWGRLAIEIGKNGDHAPLWLEPTQIQDAAKAASPAKQIHPRCQSVVTNSTYYLKYFFNLYATA